MADVPAPKTVIQISAIEKVETQEDKLIVRHADKDKTVWEFVCPTKRCAIEWHQKIQESIDMFREFQMGGYQSPQDFYRIRKGGATSSFGTSFEHKEYRHSPTYESSPPREFPRLEATTTHQYNQPSAQLNFNMRTHDDEVSRSVFDSTGPKANTNQFGASFNQGYGTSYNVQNNNEYRGIQATNAYSSPIKTAQYETSYQINQSPTQTVGMNINLQGQGSSTQGSSMGGGRSFSISSSSSLGRYPMGVPVGNPQAQLNHNRQMLQQIQQQQINQLQQNPNQFHV